MKRFWTLLLRAFGWFIGAGTLAGGNCPCCGKPGCPAGFLMAGSLAAVASFIPALLRLCKQRYFPARRPLPAPPTQPARLQPQTDACHHREAGGCTGCLTGNPCAACRARKDEADAVGLRPPVRGAVVRAAGFTLIELLIVIGLLGALTALVLPRLTVTKTWAVDESLAPAEMMDIRRAYAAFQADCLPTAADRVQIARYGLAILMTTNIAWTSGWSFPLTFDPNRGKGWRGPYLQREGERTVYLNTAGQALTGSGPTALIPVVRDPRHATDAAAGAAQRFYRVVMHTNTLYLVYVGADAVPGSGDDVEQPLEAP